MTTQEKIPSARDFSTFSKAINDIMIEVTTERRQKNANPSKTSFITRYDNDTINNYIETGNTAQLREISRYFFYRSGFYRRMLVYFATILLYANYVTPNLNTAKTINEKKVMKKYQQALNYVNELNLDVCLPRIVVTMFMDGAYFGLVNEISDTEIAFRDLPPEYCRTINKTGNGINILEFDVTYFDKMGSKEATETMLKSFPKIIQKSYRQYKSKGQDYQWVMVPPDQGVAFTIADERPPFISMIPAIINLEDYRGLDRAKDEQDLHRIFVQKMPLYQNELIFTLEEAKEIHKATSRMLRDVDNVDVLTTFADITVPTLKDSRQLVQDNLEKVEKSIFAEAGVSKEIFSPTRNLSLSMSIQNDLSYAMSIVAPIRVWIQFAIRNKFNDTSISFDFDFMPITYYNQKEMIAMHYQQATAGYSKLLLGIASGTKQHQVVNLVNFENEYLDIVHNLVPLQTSHTIKGDQIHDPGGAPQKDDTQRTQKTDDNKQSGNAGGEK